MKETTEIIEIIDKEINDIKLKQIKNKAEFFSTDLLGNYINTLRDNFYLLKGEQNSLIRVRNKIMELLNKKGE